MRGTKAKAIRKQVYGDISLKSKRRYMKDESGSVRNIGIRAAYQNAKKQK
jgi:hypothetical protein